MGWATLMVAGAGAYYFAKKDINAHRREQELKGLRGTEFLDCKSPPWKQFLSPIALSLATLVVHVRAEILHQSKAFCTLETSTDEATGQQMVDRGEAAKSAAAQSRSPQDDKSRKPQSKKRSHDDKLG